MPRSYRTNRRTRKRYPIGDRAGYNTAGQRDYAIFPQDKEASLKNWKIDGTCYTCGKPMRSVDRRTAPKKKYCATCERKTRRAPNRHTRPRSQHGGVGSNTGRDITGKRATKIFPDSFFGY